jgi:hypothetical protein
MGPSRSTGCVLLESLDWITPRWMDASGSKRRNSKSPHLVEGFFDDGLVGPANPSVTSR